MTDKQQIEEMRCLIRHSIVNNANIYTKRGGVKADKQGIDNIALDASGVLYIANYRKIDENAVVLTREEFDRMNSCIKTEEEVRAIMEQQMLPMVRELTDKEMNKKLSTVTALARKETAKEILDVLLDLETPVDYKLFYDVLCSTLSYLCDKYGVYAGNYNELAKKFGWEVEE